MMDQLYRDRKAVSKVKQEDVPLVTVTGNEFFDANSSMSSKMLSALKEDFTPRAKKCINYIEGDRTYDAPKFERSKTNGEVAEYFGVTKQAVSKVLINSRYDLVLEAESHIVDLLDMIDEFKLFKG